MYKLLHGNLKQKLLELILLAAAASVLLFWGLNQGVELWLERGFHMSGYIAQQYSRTAQQLQYYVDMGHVGMSNSPALTAWVNAHREVQLAVYQDGVLTYHSDSSDLDPAVYLQDSDPGYDRVRHYSITFSDGLADVYIFGSFDYQFYIMTDAAELVVCCAVFLLIVTRGVSICIRTIHGLETSVAQMEGGELGCPVPVTSSDEIGQLARQLDGMRLSLAAQIRTEREAREANRELIAAMSHDLRTPLTALLLYTQLLKNKKYRSEEEREAYVARIDSRALQIKNLSDALFCHFLIDGQHPAEITAEQVKAVFPDLLSDFICTLQAKGFVCVTDGTWPDAQVLLNEDYLLRIMDNLLSNLFKYADRAAPVQMEYHLAPEGFVLTLRNRVTAQNARVPSSRIGLGNVTAMMQQIGGSYAGEEKGGVFCSRLCFPLKTAGRQA